MEPDLEQLFRTCDRRKQGFIGKSAFRELCASIDISSADADNIFVDLDRDGNGQIDFEDFQSGFRDLIPSGTHSRRNTRKASRCQISDEMESTVANLVQELEEIKREKLLLEEQYKREREAHQEHLKTLEEELDAQVAKVAEKARHDAEHKFETEKRLIQKQMENEISDLQTHLRLFQKVENWLHKEEKEKQLDQDAWKHFEEASQENRQLRVALSDAQTTLLLLRTELNQVRNHYEEKYRQLHCEKESLSECVYQNEQSQRQLQLLRNELLLMLQILRICDFEIYKYWNNLDANRQLQDMNDNLRASMDSSLFYLSPRPSPSPSLLEAERCRVPAFQLTNHPDPEKLSDSGHGSLMLTSNGHGNLQISAFPEGPRSLQDELKLTGHDGERYYTPNLVRRSTSAEPTGPPDRTFKVVFAGDAAVGKSSFISRLYTGEFVSHLNTTLGVDFRVKSLRVDERNISVQLWDTAGQERFRSITKSYFRRADGVMLLFDVTNERSFVNVRQWLQNIDESIDKRIPIILCGTKADLKDQSNGEYRRCVAINDAQRLAKECAADYVETSAVTGLNVVDSLVLLIRQMTTCEDVEVQTSFLRLGDPPKKSNCYCSKGSSNDR